MEILLNDKIPVNHWREIIKTNQFSTAFQTPEFFNLFNSVKGLSAEAIAVTDKDRIIALAIVTIQKESGLKSFFSRRGIIYGGPLIDPEYPEALDLLLKQISSKLNRTVVYLEIRNLSNYGLHKLAFANNGWDYIPYINFNLNTLNKDHLIKDISKSRLRQIKKAIDSGAIWKISENVDEVGAWFEILADLYKRKVKRPHLPWDFFLKAFQNGFGKYLLVYYQNKVIGGIFCPILNYKTIYEFYVCGLDSDFKEQYPSVMATWAALEYASENHIEMFDFMGAGKDGEKYGVREFKARFGGKKVEFGRFLKINNSILYFIGRIGLSIKQKF